MNKVILIGRICAAPEAHTTQSGISRSTFKVAVQRKYKNSAGNYDADFLTVIAWRQNADFCNKYLDKGRKVAVEGSIQTRQYDAQDGSKRFVTEIIADHVEIMDKRETTARDTPPSTQRNEQQRMDTSGFTEVDPGDELPFD